jgi:hypothetical protein
MLQSKQTISTHKGWAKHFRVQLAGVAIPQYSKESSGKR